MSLFFPKLFSLIISAGLGALLLPGAARACAGLSSDAPSNQPTGFYVATERAVIIWDEAHKIEHFIRQASFVTAHADMGFLVPTPQTPELDQVNPLIFNLAAFPGNLAKVAPTNEITPWNTISPLVENPLLHFARLSPSAWLSGFGTAHATLVGPSVLAERDLADYHATILAADDEGSMDRWLQTNGYLATPELRAWLKPYIAGKWKITAFKLKKKDDSTLLTTAAIRLSFPTDRPFYPYSEPSDRQQAGAASPVGRGLMVAILSNNRMTGTKADQTPWPGRLEFAGPVVPPRSKDSEQQTKQWLRYANLDDAAHDTSLPVLLTTMTDQSNPRPGTADLYFSPDTDQHPFQGQAVDFDIPIRQQLTAGHSLSDVAALLMVLILPGVPLYCGWKVLHADISTPRAVAPSPRHPLVHTMIGTIAILVGAFYGVQFTLLLLGQLVSSVLGWSALNLGGIGLLVALLAAALPVAAMAWGVIFCGVNLCGIPTVAHREGWRARLFNADAAGQGFMATASLLAGAIFLLTLLDIFYPLLNS